MRTALRRMGNSTGMIVPKPILTEIGAAAGAAFEISVENGRIVLAPLAEHPRAGWAEAAQAIGAEDDGAAEWRSFAKDEDDALQW